MGRYVVEMTGDLALLLKNSGQVKIVETLVEDDLAASRGMTPERAAQMITDKIKGTPNLTLPTIQSYVQRYLGMVGYAPKDAQYLTALVQSNLQDMGLL